MRNLGENLVRTWRPAAMLLSLLAILLVPAAFRAEDRPVFSHETHLGEDLECDACHDLGGEGKAASLKLGGCEDCHDDGVPGTRLAAEARPLKMRFPHAAHVEAAECKDCHAATMADEQKAGEPVMELGRCISCHQENGVETPESACQTCHGVDQRRVEPSSHDRAWQERHGRESRWSVVADHGEDCYDCHARDACRRCHTQTRPRSHTGLWRMRVHGTAASWDRSACQTCHETGTCISCHSRTAPLNHRGPWTATHGLVAGSRTDERCTTCHIAAQDCIRCHSGR